MDNIEESIKAILAWSEEVGEDKGFDADYIYSLQNYFEEHGKLTDKQMNAMVRIVEKWQIDISEYT